ncbi:hypothetical protein L0P10_18715, partial [Eggerthella lenta]|nr:hypothetical protein [Eggerthella lenta]
PGLMGAGLLIERFGYPVTVTVFCAVGLLFTFFIGLRWRASVWQWRQASSAAARVLTISTP